MTWFQTTSFYMIREVIQVHMIIMVSKMPCKWSYMISLKSYRNHIQILNTKKCIIINFMKKVIYDTTNIDWCQFRAEGNQRVLKLIYRMWSLLCDSIDSQKHLLFFTKLQHLCSVISKKSAGFYHFVDTTGWREYRNLILAQILFLLLEGILSKNFTFRYISTHNTAMLGNRVSNAFWKILQT